MTEWPSFISRHARNCLIVGGGVLAIIGVTLALLHPQGSIAAVVGVALLLLLLWSLLHLSRVRNTLSILRHAIDTVGNAILITDSRKPGNPVVLVNSAFSSLTGYVPGAILGRTGRILEGPDTDTKTMNKIDAALSGGSACRTRIKLYRCDGRAFWSELSISPLCDTHSRPAFSIWELAEVNDEELPLWAPQPKEGHLELLTGERSTMPHEAARQAATDVLADSTTLDEAAHNLLRTLCEHLEWDRGLFWVIDQSRSELRCQAVWPPQADSSAHRGEIFPQTMGSPCEDLAGRVWRTGEPECLSEAQKNPWSSQPCTNNPEAGTSPCGVGYPVKLSGQVVAVLEFYGEDFRQHNLSMMSVLAEVAHQTSEAIRRMRAEERCQGLEARIRRAQKGEAVINLAGGIAHDLNNTLAAMLGFAELAFSSAPSRGRARTHLTHIMKAGSRAKDLIQQILNFARHAEPGRTPIRLHAIVTEALKLLRPSLPATIELREAILTESDTVLADPVQLHQVLITLFTSVEYAMRGGGGQLEVRLEEVQLIPGQETVHPSLEPPAYVRLTVRGTRTGTPAEVEERLDEPVYPNAVSGEAPGTGLSVAKQIVADHGGTILVDRRLQEGTRVEVYLPRIEPSLPGEAVSTASMPKGTERILFVEDEEALAEMGREMLEDLGYETVVRTDPNEALQAFLTIPQRFDLVITDQTMPHMTGDMLATEILRVRPDVPILLLTGFSHVMDWEKAKTLGIQAYLKKPLSLHELAVGIRQVLDGKSKDCRGKAERPEKDENLRETLTQPT